jgi:hypothetical protein
MRSAQRDGNDGIIKISVFWDDKYVYVHKKVMGYTHNMWKRLWDFFSGQIF